MLEDILEATHCEREAANIIEQLDLRQELTDTKKRLEQEKEMRQGTIRMWLVLDRRWLIPRRGSSWRRRRLDGKCVPLPPTIWDLGRSLQTTR